MKLEKQINLITESLDELKAEDIIAINVINQSSDMEAIIVASGRSTQHTKGIANNVKIEAKRQGMKVLGIEGLESGEWVLVDLAEVIVHIMTYDTRDFYKLEKLWSSHDK
ncbi:MAG TPA: ribosome silencing factor [Candidatus Thioglobus sp.]|nr:ribosome silencing factor [Candidatus Thioglobus sp.]HIL42073.1 ribosome silencing factor [Gammaproteobacteria bacterium]